MTREDFEKKYENGNVNIVEKIANLDNDPNNFNVFKILGLTDYEIRHSNFLAWLFNNKTFFKMFIQTYNDNINADPKIYPNITRINEESIVLEKMEIKREEHFIQKNEDNDVYIITDKETKETIYKEKKSEGVDYYTLNKGENGEFEKKLIFDKKRISRLDSKKGKPIGRYIDLNIIGDDFTITIENKIDSDEHDFQCIAYHNYVKNTYSGKEHYYVYLAKEKPEDFNSDKEDGLYPEYVFIDYKMIREILVDSGNTDNEIQNNQEEVEIKIKEAFDFTIIEKEIVKQYVSVIDEWEKIPTEYVNCLKEFENNNNEDLSVFTDSKTYDKINLTQEEERFIELANRYYKQKKADVDKIIRPAVEDASRDKAFIKSDYGRGSYAVAIPLSLEVFNYNEKKKYLEKTYLGQKDSKDESIQKIKKDEFERIIKYEANNEKEKKQIQELIDDKIRIFGEKKRYIGKNKWAFQTVDYRGPMEGLNNPSIGIYAGLSKAYSEKLCAKLIDDDFINKLYELTDWSIELNFYFKNGGGFNKDSKRIECNFDIFKKLSIDERKNIFRQDIHGQKTKDDITGKGFEEYLNCLENSNLFDNKKFSKWKEDLANYFTKKKDKEPGKCVYFGWRLGLTYEIDNFEEQYKAHKDKLKKLFIEKTKEGVKPFGDEYEKWFSDIVFENES